MNTEDINKILKDYKDSFMGTSTNELDEYELGFVSGIEYALAMHERRPVMYVRKDRSYSEHDKVKFPERFL